MQSSQIQKQQIQNGIRAIKRYITSTSYNKELLSTKNDILNKKENYFSQLQLEVDMVPDTVPQNIPIHTDEIYQDNVNIKSDSIIDKKYNVKNFSEMEKNDIQNFSEIEKNLRESESEKNSPEIDENLKEIDKEVQEITKQMKETYVARKPYDVDTKQQEDRQKEQPVDPNKFFSLLNMNNIKERTSKAYNMYLQVLSVKGTMDQVIPIVKEMQENGIPFFIHTYTNIIKVCRRPITKNGKDIVINEMKRTQNLFNKNNFLKYPSVPSIEQIKDTLQYKVLPHTERRYGIDDNDMLYYSPNIINYGTCTRRTKLKLEVEYAFYIFELARMQGIEPDTMLYTILMDVCGEHRHFERSYILFETMLEHQKRVHSNEIKYNNDKYEMTHKTNRELQIQLNKYKSLLKIDQRVVLTILKAAWKSKLYNIMENLFIYCWSNLNIVPDNTIYNLMIRSSITAEKSFIYFEQMQHFNCIPSLITYSSLLRNCIRDKRIDLYPKIFSLFNEMLSQGFIPNTQIINILLYSTCQHGDLQTCLLLWNYIDIYYKHLKDCGSYEIVLRTINKTMYNESLPHYGSVYTLDKQHFINDISNDIFTTSISIFFKSLETTNVSETTKTIRLSRADRINLAENIFAQYITQDTTIGSILTSDRRISCDILDNMLQNINISLPIMTLQNVQDPSPMLFAELVGVYTSACVGIMMQNRHEEECYTNTTNIKPLTIDTKQKLLQNTWNKINILRERFTTSFRITEHMYSYIFSMYGAADRLEDSISHYIYLTKELGLIPTKKTFNTYFKWIDINRHLGVAKRMIHEMKLYNYTVSPEYITKIKILEKKLQSMEYIPSSYPLPIRENENDNSKQGTYFGATNLPSSILNTKSKKKNYISINSQYNYPGSFNDW